jgi:hypothetical protein
MGSLLAELGIVCSRCQRLNESIAAQGVACGQPFVAQAGPPAPQPTPAPRPSAPTPPMGAAWPSANPPPPAAWPTAAPAQPRPPPPRPAGPFGAPLPPGLIPGAPRPTPAAMPATPPPQPVRPPPPAPPRGPVTAPPPPAAWAHAASTPFSTPAPVQAQAQVAPPAVRPVPPAPVAAPPPAAGPRPAGDRARLVVARGTTPGMSFRLASAPVGAGSSKGMMLFPEDPYLSALHATFLFRDGKLFVRDEGGPSGTFVRIHGPEILTNGGQFAVGDHLVRFLGPLVPPPSSGPVPYGAPVPAGALFSLEVLFEGGRPGRACTRPGPVLSVGRAACDLNLADSHVEPRHCEVVVDAMGALLRDLATPDGTFIRLAPSAERSLIPGDAVRIGSQVIKVEAS